MRCGKHCGFKDDCSLGGVFDVNFRFMLLCFFNPRKDAAMLKCSFWCVMIAVSSSCCLCGGEFDVLDFGTKENVTVKDTICLDFALRGPGTIVGSSAAGWQKAGGY